MMSIVNFIKQKFGFLLQIIHQIDCLQTQKRVSNYNSSCVICNFEQNDLCRMPLLSFCYQHVVKMFVVYPSFISDSDGRSKIVLTHRVYAFPNSIAIKQNYPQNYIYIYITKFMYINPHLTYFFSFLVFSFFI